MQGAKAVGREEDAAMCAEWRPEVAVETVDGEAVLKITLPEGISDKENVRITSQILGNPRITEAGYENPDGSPIVIDTDLQGKALSEHPQAGPIQGLKSGENIVKLGKYGAY